MSGEPSSTGLSSMEPMDCNTTPNNSPAHIAKIPAEDDAMVDNSSVSH
jgi:protein O-GlcNAcase/histone acetyltransferase